MSDIRRMLDDLSGKTLARLCEERDLKVSGPNDERRKRLSYSFRGDVDALVDLLLRPELIVLLEGYECSDGDAIGWFKGLGRAELDELQKLARKVFGDEEWRPSTRTEWPLPTSRIRLVWDDREEEEDHDDDESDGLEEDSADESDEDSGESDGDGEEDRAAALREWLEGKLSRRGRSNLLVKTLVRKLGKRRATRRLSTVAVQEVGEVLDRAGFEMEPDLSRVTQSPGIDARVRISRRGERERPAPEPGFKPIPPGPVTPPSRGGLPPPPVFSEFEQAAHKLQFLVSVASTIAKLDESRRTRAVDCALQGESVSAADRIRLKALAHQYAGAHGDLTATLRFLAVALAEDERRRLLADLRTVAPATPELEELLAQYAMDLCIEISAAARSPSHAEAADGGHPEAAVQAGGLRDNRSLDDIFGRREGKK